MAQQVDEIFEKVDQKKADRFRDRLENLREKVENAQLDSLRTLDQDDEEEDMDETHPVAQQIEATMENVDNIITTLQEDEQVTENEIQQIRDRVKTLDELEKTGAHGYHLTIKEIKEGYKELHEHKDARIREWKSYMQELSELKVRLYRKLSSDLNEERATKETVSRIQDFMENREQEHLDILTDRFENLRSDIGQQIQVQVSKETTELRQEVTRQEKEIEFLQERWQQSMDVIEQLLPLLQDTDTSGQKQQMKEVREEAEDLKNGVNADLQEKAEDAVEELKEEQEPVQAEPEETASEQSSGPDSLFADPLDDEETEKDDGPEYRLKEKSVEEMREVFEEIEANENTEDMSFRDIAEKTDVSYESVRQKHHKVSKQYSDFETQLGR